MADNELLQTTIYADLRERMLSGQIAAGGRVSEQHLADEFEVSRMPVRQALARLAHDGLIEQSSRVRSSVISPTLSDLQESLELRCLLEPHAAELATLRLSWIELETLENACNESHAVARTVRDQRKLTAASVKAELYADMTFHRVIWKAANRPRLAKFCDDLHLVWRIGTPLDRPIDDVITVLETAAEFHQQIFDALKQQDASEAAKHMRRHIESNRPGLANRAREMQGL